MHSNTDVAKFYLLLSRFRCQYKHRRHEETPQPYKHQTTLIYKHYPRRRKKKEMQWKRREKMIKPSGDKIHHLSYPFCLTEEIQLFPKHYVMTKDAHVNYNTIIGCFFAQLKPTYLLMNCEASVLPSCLLL